MSDILEGEDFAGTLKLLASWGFKDTALNRKALYHSGGQIQQAIEYIENPQAAIEESKPKPPPREPEYLFSVLDDEKKEAVLTIGGMGFTDEGKIRNALSLSDWKVQDAVELLLADNGMLSSSFEGRPSNAGRNTSSAITDFPQSSTRNDLYSNSYSNSNSYSYTGTGGPVATGYSYTNPSANVNYNSSATVHYPPQQVHNPFTTSNQEVMSNYNNNPFGSSMPTNTGPNYNIHQNMQTNSVFSSVPVKAKEDNPFADTPSRQKYGNISEFDPFSDNNRI